MGNKPNPNPAGDRRDLSQAVSRPRVIVIHGPAAAGKYTIARELSQITGLGLFHNHLTVDLLLAAFPFGSPPFVRHRERIWLDVMGDAVGSGTSLIFTFNPEASVSSDFPAVLSRRIEARGGSVAFVAIECAEDEIERRIGAASRQGFRKLDSLELYQKLRAGGAFDYPPIRSELTVDSTVQSPRESALRISEHFRLLPDGR